MNTENLLLNFPKPYFDKLIADGKIDNIKAFKDGSFKLIKGENSITIFMEMLEAYLKENRIKVAEHKHLVKLVEDCVRFLEMINT